MREWIHGAGDTYAVTGIDVRGRRFRIRTGNPWQALAVNLYRGSVWLVRDGKRKLVKRVWN
ncbi:MAG TPA: hypothetical protein VIL45_07060 [Thermoplasmata archaeon]